MSSRQKDLAHLEEQILELGAEARSVQGKFQEYNAKVGQRIREILERAGVWEEVNTLERERNEASQKAQAKLQDLDARAKDLQRVRAFLLGREQEDPEAGSEKGAEDENPSEDVDPPEDKKGDEPTPEQVWDEDDGDKGGDLKPPEF
jgi:hypothetical protein